MTRVFTLFVEIPSVSQHDRASGGSSLFLRRPGRRWITSPLKSFQGRALEAVAANDANLPYKAGRKPMFEFRFEDEL